MKHETPTIKAEPRERVGSRYAQRLRKTGRLPAVIYGHKVTPIPVSVDETEILNAIRHGAHALSVEIEGRSAETCLVKDLQYGYLGDNVIHVDFTRVSLDEEVTVNVHMAFVGTPEEAHKHDTIIRHDLTELTIVCKVSEIPEEIKVDLARMEGSSLTAGEIAMPEGVRIAIEPETHVASVMHLRGLAVEVGEEAEVAADAGEPEVITEARGDETEAEAKTE